MKRTRRHGGCLVTLKHAFRRPIAHAGPQEDDLHHDGAFDENAKHQTDHRNSRNQGIAASMPTHHDPLRQPLGPSRVDVVVPQLFDQGRPHHAGHDRRGGVAEDEGRKNQVPDRVEECRRTPGQDRIDRVEPGRMGDARPHLDIRPADREPAEARPEDDQHENPEPEGRHAGAAHCHHPGQLIGPPITPSSSEHFHGDPEDDGDEARDRCQLKRCRQLVHEHRGHGGVGHGRPAEVTLADVLEPGEVLNW